MGDRREVQEERNVCVHIADSLCCTAETMGFPVAQWEGICLPVQEMWV